MIWNRIDRLLDRLRTHRQVAVLLADAGLIMLAWHATYLFRLGVERWLHERPSYDTPVINVSDKKSLNWVEHPWMRQVWICWRYLSDRRECWVW
mgnify:CR=1 FL=1